MRRTRSTRRTKRHQRLLESRDIPLPLTLPLEGVKRPLCLKKALRTVPGKRLIVSGTWDNQRIVAKLFTHSRRATRHAVREREGVAALVRAGLLAPTLLYAGRVENSRAQVLIFEMIPGRDFYTLWCELIPADQQALVLQLVGLIAKQHQQGLYQSDLHPNNFLVGSQGIVTLDGSGIISTKSPLTKRKSLKNLALLFSQFPPNSPLSFTVLFEHYARQRGWLHSLDDVKQLERYMASCRDRRLAAMWKKVFRSTTDCISIKGFTHHTLIRRKSDSPELRAMLNDLDGAIDRGHILKPGNSSTVSVVRVNHQELVVKRYNLKSPWRRLRRCLRSTRAAQSWRHAFGLPLLGINTPRPVAMVEKRFGPFRGESYFISEFLPGVTAEHYFLNGQNPDEMADRLIGCFRRLFGARMHHGDMKAINFLIHNQEPWVIDLDRMRQHQCRAYHRHRQQRDIERFLRNWQRTPDLHRRFSSLVEDLL